MASLPPESFLSMNSREPSRNQANREYSQLLRMQERILGQILRIRDELLLRSQKASCTRSATVLALPLHRPWRL